MAKAGNGEMALQYRIRIDAQAERFVEFNGQTVLFLWFVLHTKETGACSNGSLVCSSAGRYGTGRIKLYGNLVAVYFKSACLYIL